MKQRPAIHGVVGTGLKTGTRIDWESPTVLKQGLANMPDGRIVATFDVASEKAVRSLKANRYYRYALGLISKDTGNDADDLHEFYLEEFLKRKVFLTNRHTGEVVEREITQRSKKLSPEDFWDFVERVRQHAAEFFNVNVPDPDPEWRRHDRSAA